MSISRRLGPNRTGGLSRQTFFKTIAGAAALIAALKKTYGRRAAEWAVAANACGRRQQGKLVCAE